MVISKSDVIERISMFDCCVKIFFSCTDPRQTNFRNWHGRRKCSDIFQSSHFQQKTTIFVQLIAGYFRGENLIYVICSKSHFTLTASKRYTNDTSAYMHWIYPKEIVYSIYLQTLTTGLRSWGKVIPQCESCFQPLVDVPRDSYETNV